MMSSTPPPTPPAFDARIFKITDGDTIVVTIAGNTEEIKIRLACIDAPERSQDGGRPSTEQMKTLLPLGAIVQIVPTGSDDRYGRKIGFVFYGGTNINLEQVATGQAWVYDEYLNTCPRYAPMLKDAQAKAKLNRVGLWVDATPCAPWDWRSKRCLPLPKCEAIESSNSED